jgi:hypothetical protein
LAQGPDQVYRAADGIVHVIEAKGGTSPLITAYGFPQGSSEWAVESAKRVVNSSRAAATEKAAAQQVLKAAAEGRVQVHVVRTRYIVGEPTVSVLEQTATGTDEAALLARDLLEHVRAATPKAGTTPVREAADYVAQSADDVARTSAKNGGKLCRATKAAVVVGATVDVGFRVHHGMQVENSFRAGQISQQQREVAHAKNAAGIVGGWGGAFAGAKVGALGGGAVGTACGGVGAPIGAAAGGIAGGVAGYFVGEAAAEAAAGWTMEQVHAAGTTIADAATSTKRGITNASRYVWDD